MEISPYAAAGYTAASLLYTGAQINQLRGLSYDGGGGSSAVPTFNANPSTGLPSGGGSSSGPSVNLTLVVNGQRMNLGELTAGVMQTLYDNNGSVDGFTMQVERHA
jgi:hypothetical protein